LPNVPEVKDEVNLDSVTGDESVLVVKGFAVNHFPSRKPDRQGGPFSSWSVRLRVALPHGRASDTKKPAQRKATSFGTVCLFVEPITGGCL